ncbi:hypothetical protein DVH05_009258 [Phytophthora capsici]|nr:hypothetical protein DVH05_009258 [Phytophthora capsici]
MVTSTRLSISLLLVVASILSSSTAGNLRHTSRNLQTYTQTDGYQTKMLELVNEQRVANGLSSLCMNSKLASSSLRHSKDMAANNYMAHNGSDGSTVETFSPTAVQTKPAWVIRSSMRITQAGFVWTAVGENVAAGQETISDVMTAWMNSPEHKANILGDYKMFGTAYAYSADTTYQHYWTQDFGTGEDESCENSSSSSGSDSTDQTQDATTQGEVAGEATTTSETTSPIIEKISTTAPTATSETPTATTAVPTTSDCKARM